MYSTIIICTLISLAAADRTYLDSLESCNTGEVAEISNVHLFRSKDGEMQLIACDLRVKHKIQLRNSKLLLKLDKCTSANVSTCSPYPSMTLPSICNLKNIAQLPIKDIFDSLNPPVDCTFEQRTYKMRNCKFDLSDFKLFALGNYYWNVKVLVLGRNENYLCFKGKLHLA